MAKAPRPGAVREAKEAGAYFKLTLRGRTLTLPKAIPLKEKFAIQIETGRPIEFFMLDEDRFGEASFSLLWWLAERANGKPNLSFEEHLEAWPTDLAEGDLGAEVVDDDNEATDDPEGSGPAC